MGKSLSVVVFCCNWEGLSCVEAAAKQRLSYSAAVKIIRVTCLARVHLGLILKAFEFGADGVMLLGCEVGNCHYDSEPHQVISEVEKAHRILRLIGLRPERVILAGFPRADGSGFVSRVQSFVAQLGTAGAGALTGS